MFGHTELYTEEIEQEYYKWLTTDEYKNNERRNNMGSCPHLLDNEINESFRYVKKENCKGINFEIYADDYGQSYVLAWIDPRTKEIKQWCCGTYNDYNVDMEDIANYMLGVKDNGIK